MVQLESLARGGSGEIALDDPDCDVDPPAMHPRAHVAPILLLLACGPASPAATDGGSSGTEAGSTDVSMTESTPTSTGSAQTCDGLQLPQALPMGANSAYWVPVGLNEDPGGAIQLYMVEDTVTCDTDPPCVPNGPPQLFGYFVVLEAEHRATGVYPVSADILADGVWIGALLQEWDGSQCQLRLGLAAGSDGEVEVLADQDGCVAIDVRGVTPTKVDDVTLDPNGSAQTATQCSP